MRRFWYSVFASTVLMTGAMTGAVHATEQRTFTITEPFGLEWQADRVDYHVAFPAGQVAPDGVALADAAGNPVAVQLSDIQRWPDKKTVKSATVSFMAALKPDEVSTWKLTAGTKPVRQPGTDLKANKHGNVYELTTTEIGIRLPAGEKTFKQGIAATSLPAPIQGVRLLNGQWIGKGWWSAERPCLGYTCTLVEQGPVFARVQLRYTFTDNTAYTATVELNAGQEIAQVREEFNLSEGKAYEMPEQPGEDKTVKYRYVVPKFDNPGGAMLWDWWGGSHGRVTAPNGYQFAFYDGLAPDSLEWYGNMRHKAAEPGAGGLKYPDDQRVISINAWLNWGDDETMAVAAYNSKDLAAGQVCIMGLRPSQWLNPDLDPHPMKTLKQFTQTNNMWLERRATPELQLRVPTCLGKRMYGIGVMPRQQSKDAQGTVNTTSDLLHRVRALGRTRVDDVKDWVLDYDEPAVYPRLFTKPGDMATLLQRTKNNAIKNDNFHRCLIYLTDPRPETARQLIETELKEVPMIGREMMGIGPQGDGQYYMAMQWWSADADIALGLKECTPAEARRLRRYIAATAYMTRSADVHPRRENGYCWGSINMPTQWRQASAMLACLVPNHPRSAEWRREMATFFGAEIMTRTNPAGASEEVGAYGGITIIATASALGAILRTDPTLDIKPVLDRLRAVANDRLQYLMPPDVRGGFRLPCPIGDSPYAAENTLGCLWYLFEQADPKLAANLAWGIREGKVQPESGMLPGGLLYDLKAPEAAPDLKSEHLAGAGFVMHSGYPAADETYLNINAGGYSFGHGHPDRGAFILYAKGAPLMMDFGPQYVPSMRHTMCHPGGITFDHDESIRKLGGMANVNSWFHARTAKPDKDYEIEPFTCLQPGIDPRATNFDDAFMKDVYFKSTPTADYAVAEQQLTYMDRVPYMVNDVHGQQWLSEGNCSDPVFLQHPFKLTRQYVFVKSADPQGPNYLVIRDTMPDNTDHRPALNLWCLADKLEVNGQLATYTGQHGVDLDVYVAEPARLSVVTHKAAHTNGRDLTAHYTQTFGKPFKEEQILLQIPQQPGGGFFTVLVPRKAGEPAPKFETLPGGNAVRVTFPDRVDTIVLQPAGSTVEVDGKTITSTAALLVQQGGKLDVVDLSAK